MTITVEITPEVEAELARQAAGKGRAIEEHAARLLQEAAHVLDEKPRLTPEGLKIMLEEMAQFSHKIPSLPDEAFTRENLNRDYD